ncbi:MAG TPA: trypsin-like peptidase domain-containing protein [Thermoplasmata archaeon]|nr:trypsin-like peptidase domain-containing protein [Thermoplasmata archaeon]
MPLSEFESRITTAVEAVGPSVAGIESLHLGRRRGSSPFGAPARATAVVIDPAGYLITNQHVVEGAAQIRVHLPDGRDLPGEVVGGDEATDVAVVKVDGIDLPPARLGASENLRVGQLVLAVGHALGLPGGPTVSVGVVSALGRPLPGSDFIFEGLIQTDAAINPGNSGGPLVDLDGAVVGINSAMVPFAQGVGFALPIHAVARIADELRRHGRVVRPWIGVMVAELGPDLARQYSLAPWSGLLVAEVVARSPAHRAGLRPGDLVQQVGPFGVTRVRELLESLGKFPVGSEVQLTVQRRGAALTMSVPLQEHPETIPARG